MGTLICGIDKNQSHCSNIFNDSYRFNGPKAASLAMPYRPFPQSFEKLEIAPRTPGSSKAALRGFNSPALILSRPSPVDQTDLYTKGTSYVIIRSNKLL